MSESEIIQIVESAEEINGFREKMIFILKNCGYYDADLLSNQELLEEFLFTTLYISKEL